MPKPDASGLNTPEALEALVDSIVREHRATVETIQRRCRTWANAAVRMADADADAVFATLEDVAQRLTEIRLARNSAIDDVDDAIELVSLRMQLADARTLTLGEVTREVRPYLEAFDGLLIRLVAVEAKLDALDLRYPPAAHDPAHQP